MQLTRFADIAKRYGVCHTISSPCFHYGNSLVMHTVKTVKAFVTGYHKTSHTYITFYRYFSTLYQFITSSNEQRVLYCIHLHETLLLGAFIIYSPVGRVVNNENLLAKKQHIQVLFHQFKELD